MNLIYGVSGVLHRIRVKLYPNYLPGGEGTFLARTDSEASLSVEQVCAAGHERGGFTGKFEDRVKYVKEYFAELAYHLCNGFAVNTGYFTIYPNIGGTFKSVHEPPDSKKHPLSFRFRAHKPLCELAKHITVEVEGEANITGYIDTFTDNEVHAVNSLYVPGNMFTITGDKIKITGGDTVCGVYFVPLDDPGKAIRVTRIAENSPSKITGIAPNTGQIYNRIEIHTQYTGSGSTSLKSPRIITSSFILEQA